MFKAISSHSVAFRLKLPSLILRLTTPPVLLKSSLLLDAFIIPNAAHPEEGDELL